MRIENEVKLDFKDVLIRPKRSTLTSRSEVDITRDGTTKNDAAGYEFVDLTRDASDSSERALSPSTRRAPSC